MKKLSFILPVYNVESYLEKCIRSLRDDEMPYKDYEIIVVNDGSPDNSEKIAKKLQSEISNILLINQKNAGVSAARNKGIEKATGEYIVFIDPDDFVTPNLLKTLYDRAKEDDLDILLSGRSLISSNGKIQHRVGYYQQEQRLFDGVTAFYEKDKPFTVFDSSVGRLYKKSLIKRYNITFPEGVVHLEDGVFVRKIFTIAKRVGFENCDFYQVFQRPGSASRSDIGLSYSAAKGDVKSANNLLNFKRSYKFDPKQIELLNISIIKYGLLPLMRAINSKDIGAFNSYYQMLVKKGFKKLETEHISTNTYLKYAKSYNISPWIFAMHHIFNLTKKNLKSKI